MNSRRRCGLPLFVTILMVSLPAQADDPPFEARIVSDRYYFSLGTSATTFRTDAQIGLGRNLGTFIRIEDDLALDNRRSVIGFNGLFSFNKKHALEVRWSNSTRSGPFLLDREVTVGEPDTGEEITYMIGARVDTRFDADSFRVAYRHDLVDTGRTQAGIGVGLSLFDYRVELVGEAMVDDGTGPRFESAARVDEEVLAPVPSLVLHIDHGFTRRFIMRAQFGYFDINIDDIEGTLVETRFNFEYFVHRHVSLGIGFSNTDIRYSDRDGSPLLVDVQQTGISFFVGGAF